MHYQAEPFAENKIISCVRGACFDVFVDLRKESPTYLKWLGFELSQSNKNMLLIPKNCAHGFQTLVDNTVLYYQIDEFYQPDYGRGLRYNDPKIGINWPSTEKLIINERDKNYALL